MSGRVLYALMALSLMLGACSPKAPEAETAVVEPAVADDSTCTAEEAWVTSPNPPDEVPNNGATLCDFYQFSYQWFLELVSPSTESPGDRNFQVAANYPFYDTSIDSCSAQPETAKPAVFVRTRKPATADGEGAFVVPDDTGQAGGGAVIFDQNNRPVYYVVQFDRGLCDAPAEGNLPAGTTEIKTSWRDLTGMDSSGYFTMETDIVGLEGTRTLGLVGYHLVRSTAQHPEFVWATFEHRSNAPDCTDPQPTPDGGWSFTSAACAECLATSQNGAAGCPQCSFNAATSSSNSATEICRVYHDSTKDGDYEGSENVADIDSLNEQVNGFLGASADLSVFQNYMLVGGLWESDPSLPSTDAGNQRGSLQLANTTMETDFQDGANCFSCHGYTPNETATTGLSHIFSHIHGQ